MSAPFFGDLAPIAYAGPESRSPLAFRWYDKDRVVLGKRMEEHMRFAVCYWHSFTWPGGDPFGGETFLRPWMHGADEMALARAKADVAFDLFRILGVPFYTFHDRDVAPEGATLAESNRNVREIAEIFARKQEETGIGLLWGTANLFSNRRFMSGAATNPDPDVFTFAAAQVKNAIDVTRELGGSNYVLWGGREGYETLLNTSLSRELDQAGRFLSMVVDYKHRTGFKGTILIEPKPKEPTKHQYDYDVATVYGFLARYGLEKEVKVNIEQNHALLAGHTFEHELAMARALGIFGSVDLNRGDGINGWDTDQFAMSGEEMTLAWVEILRAGGFTDGGFNFDAKIRRQSLDPEDLVIAHVASMDVTAKALLAAAAIVEDGDLDGAVAARYAGWDGAEGKAILAGERSLEDLAARAEAEGLDPQPKSGRQEYLERLVSLYH
ncbi:xylose isomerase [Oharaeibacter diazotrophicus]|uniref:Xylose isomerase n=1 Tax=Oharaeibacter diazotrophicus TaxID=1920512 RepID=A0A4R6RB65_9HYPH|nr:xylose isomerase [Oharaeibacter diazotrophicus]TDP83279.1 D-xylose isomerase [Oharaeibacter diazotrophicus]BBE72112.1 xylose isomerase [Pleomorphomonas sp. SM30]GLS78877.1 xylose isomerase [Oharaeibacter diazotrophicus]